MVAQILFIWVQFTLQTKSLTKTLQQERAKGVRKEQELVDAMANYKILGHKYDKRKKQVSEQMGLVRNLNSEKAKLEDKLREYESAYREMRSRYNSYKGLYQDACQSNAVRTTVVRIFVCGLLQRSRYTHPCMYMYRPTDFLFFLNSCIERS